MKRILHATVWLSGGSFLAILTGLVTGKLSALWIGPTGVGILGDFRSTMLLTSLTLGLGMTAAITRLGSKVLADGNEAGFSAMIWAAIGTTLLMMALGAIVALLWTAPISHLLYGHAFHQSPALMWLLLTVLCNLLANIEAGILRARLHFIRTLGMASVVNVLFTFILSVLALSTHHTAAMLPVFAASQGAHALMLGSLIKIHGGSAGSRPSAGDIAQSARQLYRFGGTYTVSMLVGNGVRAVVPVLVLHWVGVRNLGFYMAASTVASQYLGFLTSSLGQDYLPRLSVESVPSKLRHIIEEELGAVLLIIVPLISIVMMVAPLVIPLVYAPSFTPAVKLLEWMVAADVFRFGSWAIAYAILAKASGKFYLLVELSGGAAALLCCWLGFQMDGLMGLGWAYFITYATIGVVTLLIGFHTLPLRGASFPKSTIGIALGIVMLMRLLTLWKPGPITVAAMILVASAACIRSYKGLAKGWKASVPASSTAP